MLFSRIIDKYRIFSLTDIHCVLIFYLCQTFPHGSLISLLNIGIAIPHINGIQLPGLLGNHISHIIRCQRIAPVASGKSHRTDFAVKRIPLPDKVLKKTQSILAGSKRNLFQFQKLVSLIQTNLHGSVHITVVGQA